MERPRFITSNTQFSSNARYRGNLSSLDIEFEFEFDLDGWRVNKLSESRGDFIHTWNWSQDLATGAEGNVVLFMADQEISELARWYASNDQVGESTEPEPTTVAGHSALQFDILVMPDPIEECFGLRLVDDGPWFQNINGCTWTRVWVVDVDDVAVTVYVTAAYEDPRTMSPCQGGNQLCGENNLFPDLVWEFEDFQPLVDDFIHAVSFCTDAIPCEGD